MKRTFRNSVQLYEVMREAINYLREHAREQPDIETIARVVGMSSSRFEHAFAEWVGISPKRFLAYLTKERAKDVLASSSVLKTSYSAGLSGPGRLHDLMVTYEAVTPGEFKNGEIEITYGIHPSPFGWCVIGITKRGVCYLSFIDVFDATRAIALIKRSWPKATLKRNDSSTASYAHKIFAGRSSTPIHLLVRGTNFQIKVWEALLRIPEGQIARYADIARIVGSPRAVRAAGSACGKNPISFIIPCHRVLTSEGRMGGYGSGVERKEVILAWEQARVDKTD